MKILAQNINEFERRNIHLISMARDSQRKLKELQDNLEFPVQLIADNGGKISMKYEVLLPKGHPVVEEIGMEHALPSKFLINRQGIIVWKDLAPYKERPSLNAIIKAIETYVPNTPQ